MYLGFFTRCTPVHRARLQVFAQREASGLQRRGGRLCNGKPSPYGKPWQASLQ